MRFLAFLLLFGQSLWALPADSLHVTYIANEGFLLDDGHQAVAVDAFFTHGLNTFDAPPPAVLAQMRTATGPFARLRYMLVTHTHRDHFDAALVAAHMAANPLCQLILPHQGVAALQKQPGYAAWASRVTAIGGKFGDVESPIAASSLGLTAMMLKHGPYMKEGINKHADVQNCAYLLQLGGKTILHLGDATVDWNRHLFPVEPLKERPVDLLFLQYYDIAEASAQWIQSQIQPDQVIGMHLRLGHRERQERFMAAVYPGALFFRTPMMKKVF